MRVPYCIVSCIECRVYRRSRAIASQNHLCILQNTDCTMAQETLGISLCVSRAVPVPLSAVLCGDVLCSPASHPYMPCLDSLHLISQDRVLAHGHTPPSNAGSTLRIRMPTAGASFSKEKSGWHTQARESVLRK